MRAVVTRTYTLGEITVLWDSTRCIHVGNCLRAQPDVFKVRRRPWVMLENGTLEEIIDAVRSCPTGALRYELGGEPEPPLEHTTLVPVPNGPLLVRGHVEVVDANGTVVAQENRLALCRCGNTRNTPFCDNSHRRIRFEENAPPAEAPAAPDAATPAAAAPEAPCDICPPQDFAAEA